MGACHSFLIALAEKECVVLNMYGTLALLHAHTHTYTQPNGSLNLYI